MGNIKEITDIWGELKGYEYYDDHGNYTGKSLIQKRAFGDDYLENYDEKGNITGTSEFSRPWTFDTSGHLDHYDKYGKKTGETRVETGLFSNRETERTTDRYGKTIAEYTNDGRNFIKESQRESGQPDTSDDLPGNGYAAPVSTSGGSVFVGIILIAVIYFVFYFLANIVRPFIMSHYGEFLTLVKIIIPVIIAVIIGVIALCRSRKLISALVIAAVTFICLWLTIVMTFNYDIPEMIFDKAFALFGDKQLLFLLFDILILPVTIIVRMLPLLIQALIAKGLFKTNRKLAAKLSDITTISAVSICLIAGVLDFLASDHGMGSIILSIVLYSVVYAVAVDVVQSIRGKMLQ